MNDSEELIPCGNCERPTPPQEIRNYHGTCQFCRRSILTANLNGKLGSKRRRRESENHSSPHPPVLAENADGFAVDDDGAHVGFKQFDYADVDRAMGFLADEPETARDQAAECLARLWAYCWSAPASLRLAMGRFAILSRGLNPRLMPLNFSDIAKLLKTTKQAVSKACVKAEGHWGLKFVTTRSSSQRKTMRRARMRNPIYRGKPKKPASNPTPGKDSFQ